MKLKTLGAAASLLLTPFALANETPDASTSHKFTYYIEANLGPNIYYAPGNKTLTKGVQGLGYNLNGGYYYTETNSVEIGFMHNFVDYTDNDKTHHGTIVTGYGAFRHNTPISPKLSIITKLGVMLNRLNYDDSNSTIALPFTGIGLSYAVTDKIDISLQYQGAVYIVAGAGLLSGGVTYHL